MCFTVIDSDEVLMVTSRGKIQRIRTSDVNTIGRNTQGVRIIRLDEGDTLVSCAVIPGDVIDEEAARAAAVAKPALLSCRTSLRKLKTVLSLKQKMSKDLWIT